MKTILIDEEVFETAAKDFDELSKRAYKSAKPAGCRYQSYFSESETGKKYVSVRI